MSESTGKPALNSDYISDIDSQIIQDLLGSADITEAVIGSEIDKEFDTIENANEKMGHEDDPVVSGEPAEEQVQEVPIKLEEPLIEGNGGVADEANQKDDQQPPAIGVVHTPEQDHSAPAVESSEPAVELSEAADEPSEAAVEPCEPSVEPEPELSKPAAEPSEPVVVPSEATVEPCDPAADPSEAAVEPCEPAADPSEAAVVPCEPAAKPSGPAAEPCGSAVEPTEPEAEPCDTAVEPSQPAAELVDPAVLPSETTGEPCELEVETAPDSNEPGDQQTEANSGIAEPVNSNSDEPASDKSEDQPAEVSDVPKSGPESPIELDVEKKKPDPENIKVEATSQGPSGSETTVEEKPIDDSNDKQQPTPLEITDAPGPAAQRKQDPKDDHPSKPSQSTMDNHSRVLRQIHEYEDYINKRANRLRNWLKSLASSSANIDQGIGAKINDKLQEFEDMATDASRGHSSAGRVVWRSRQHLWKKYVVGPKRADLIYNKNVAQSAEAGKRAPIVQPRIPILSRPIVDPLSVASRRQRRYPGGEVLYEPHGSVKQMKVKYEEKRKMSDLKRCYQFHYRW